MLTPRKALSGFLALASASVIGVAAVAQDATLGPAAPANSPLAREPQTAEQYLDAALLVAQLARPDLGRYYLEQLNALNPDTATLLQLRDKFGMSSLLGLARVEGMQAPANELLDKVIAAAEERGKDPAYVQGLIDGVFGEGRAREEAVLELKHLGPYAVNPILERLAEPVNQDQGRLVYTLTTLGEPIRQAIIGALKSNVPSVRSTAAKTLGWVGTREDAIHLWHGALADQETSAVKDASRAALARLLIGDEQRTDRLTTYGVVKRMLATAREHFGERYDWGNDLDSAGNVQLWVWDTESSSLMEHKVPQRLASIAMAERLAREAAVLEPQNQQAGDLLLAALLAHDIESAGWSNPIPMGAGTAHSQAVAAGAEMCSRVLEIALQEKNAAAALGSLDALALNGHADVLSTSRMKMSAVQQALDAEDTRVQFAAAVAILSWEPTKTFANSHRIMEILSRTLNGDEKPNSVVIDPNLDRATNTAGLFSDLGYDAIISRTGREGFAEAAARGDVELAVLDLNTIQWELTHTVANLRADARTASLPIVIYGPGELRERAQNVVTTFQNVVYIDTGVTSVDIQRQLTPVLKSFSPPPLTQQQRSQQIQQAAYWLRRIAESGTTELFDLTLAETGLSSAISSEIPGVAQDAIAALSAVGRPSAQDRLSSVATAPGMDAALKRAAAMKLVSHIRKFGAMLPEARVAEIKAAAEAETDPMLETALSTVLGSLKPSSGNVIQELLKFPSPPTPPSEKADEPAAP